MGKSAPDAPDYEGAAQAQAESSREVTEQQTWANRPTINTPFGQQTWDTTPQWDPATGQYLNTWTQNTNLTPEAQSALDSQMAVQQGRSNLAESKIGQMEDEFGGAMDWDKFTGLADTPQAGLPVNGLDRSGLQGIDPSQRYYDKAEDAIYNKWSNRQEPRMQQEADRLRTQLYNSGLKEGDQAYDAEMQKLRETQNDARESAQYGATIGSGAEGSRMFGMDTTARGQQFGEEQASGAFANQAANQVFGQEMQGAGYQNTLRQQQISEEMQKRGFSLNEINAILTGQQVGMPTMPGFNTASAAQPVQSLAAAGMTGQSQLDAFNAQNAGMNSLMGGLGSMATAVKPFGF